MDRAGTTARTHYDVLEVSQTASPEVLRAAYKSLIQRYHPDRNPGDASAGERSALIVSAYQTLSDPAVRAEYDLELAEQVARLNRLNIPRREPLDAAKRRVGSEKHRRNYLAPAVLLAAVLSFFWVNYFGSRSLESESVVTAAPREIVAPVAVKDHDRLATRTVLSGIENLAVTLVPKDDLVTDTQPQPTPKHVLSIKTIVLVAGGSDSEKYTALFDSSKEYIVGKLAEQLVHTDYEKLIHAGSEDYLKQLILDMFNEITRTKQFTRESSSEAMVEAHYGAVDVLLPDSFSVVTSKPTPAPVQPTPQQ